MTSDQWIVAYLGTAAIVILALFWLVAHIAYKDGHNDGRLYERNRRNTRALEAARRPAPRTVRWEAAYAGQHAPWQPRLTVTRSMSLTVPPAGPASLTAPLSMRATDSGELRGLVDGTDAWIANLRAQEDAYRRTLVTR